MFFNIKLVAFCIAFVYIYQANGEPRCSDYHYQEKLLEKMVRMEFAMEKLETKTQSVQDAMKSTLAGLNTERNTFIEELSDFKNAMETSVNKTIDIANQRLQNKLEELHNLQTRLETKTTENILFSVKGTKSTSLTDGQTMLYTTVLSNDGDGYNIDTGIFTVPVAGVYMFNIQFCMNGGKVIDFAFLVDENAFKVSRIRRKNWDQCYDYNAYKYLNVGEKVKIKIIYLSSGSNILTETNTNFWNTFSGTLVHT